MSALFTADLVATGWRSEHVVMKKNAERKDMPDPIQNAMDSILDHMHKVDEELEELKKKVKGS